MIDPMAEPADAPMRITSDHQSPRECHLALSYRILLKHGGVTYPDADVTDGADWIEPLRRMAAVDGLPTTVGALWFDNAHCWDVVAICRPDGSSYDDVSTQAEADWGDTLRRARRRAGVAAA
jgi:hypothetical protein